METAASSSWASLPSFSSTPTPDSKYHQQLVNAYRFLQNATGSVLRMDELMRTAPMHELLESQRNAQLADASTAKECLTVITELCQQANLAAYLPAPLAPASGTLLSPLPHRLIGSTTSTELLPTLNDVTQFVEECSICMETASTEYGPLLSVCSVTEHRFHAQCLQIWEEQHVSEVIERCPICRRPPPETLLPPPPSTTDVTGSTDLQPALNDSALFVEEAVRNTTLAEHTEFLQTLSQDTRLRSAIHEFHSPFNGAQARAFLTRWLANRQINEGTYFTQIVERTPDFETFDSESYWYECVLAPEVRIHPVSMTASWTKAYHGSNISCLNAILQRGCLDTGPSGKSSNQHERHCQFGVYCHRHTRGAKAMNYMVYFQYVGFIAAPLFQLRVQHGIACGDSWCCDPHDVQIESLWLHIISNNMVYRRPRRYAIYPMWCPFYELRPLSGPLISRYSRA